MDITSDDFAVEHIIPVDAGGGNDLSNLALSCQGCNNRKFTAQRATDPQTGEVVRLFHPREDRWEDHFAWDEEEVEVIGTTSCGRATIARLQLNREPLVNLRRVLKAAETA